MPSIEVKDTIESSGFPLAFRVDAAVADGKALGGLDIKHPGTIKVEARALGGHQKEAVVTEGHSGAVWRMVSDEGPMLQGTDLAPFPLGFMNAGLQADVLGRMAALGTAQGPERSQLDGVTAELATDYAFEGSFYKGTGKGSAKAPQFKFMVPSRFDAKRFEVLIQAAMAASPLVAMHSQVLRNTFALYVNGKRRMLNSLPESAEREVIDPLKSWHGVPSPGRDEASRPFATRALIERLEPIAAPVAGAAAAANSAAASALSGESAKIDIMVRGRSRLCDSTTESEVWLARPVGSHFGLFSCESIENQPPPSAPRGLSLAMSGIAFCLMTQVLRYVGYHNMKVRALRVVQLSPFDWARDGRALALPLDTHVFVHADENDETMERLLVMAANTCYLHAALGAVLESQFTLA